MKFATKLRIKKNRAKVSDWLPKSIRILSLGRHPKTTTQVMFVRCLAVSHSVLFRDTSICAKFLNNSLQEVIT